MEGKPGIASNRIKLPTVRLSIRSKLFALLIIPFFIPLIGYSFIKKQEQILRDNEQSLLADYAKVAASILAQHENDFTNTASNGGQSNIINASPISYTPLLDGYFDDWPNHLKPALSLKSSSQPIAAEEPADIFLTTDNKSYFLFIRVSDNSINYFNPEQQINLEYPSSQQSSTYEQITFSSKGNNYAIYTAAPGKVLARRIENNKVINEPRINGYWLESQEGYNLELKVPKSLLGKELSLAISDADTDPNGNNLEHQYGININYAIASPSQQIQDSLAVFAQKGLRFWVSDLNSNVLASIGSIKHGINREKESFMTTIRKAIYRLVLKQPTTNFADTRYGSVKLENISNLKALQGSPFQHLYATPDNRAMIMSAAHPINVNDKVIGAVTVEKNSNQILLLHNKTMENIIDISILAFILTLAILLYLTTSISRKIIKLRDYTQASISPDGRIVGTIPLATATKDEISDLNDSFHSMIERVSQYNDYLENMAGRLSHELKTPLAIVSSSLDNMSFCNIPAELKIYHTRAVEGINRLRQILSAMSEATRLEQSLESTPSQQFDLADTLSSYCQGFQSCFSDIEIQTNIPQTEAIINGNKDLIAQMLDKLLTNAVDFHTPGTPIVVELLQNIEEITISISNKGKTIADNQIKQIFSPMISLRPKVAHSNNLGLGLYIAQLICKYHNGHIYAQNLSDKSGVQICAEFNLDLDIAKENA